MRRSAFQFALAAFVTVVELAVSLCALRILYDAWSANRAVLVSALAGAFVPAQSLTNLRIAAFQSTRSEHPLASSAFTQFSAAQLEGDSDV